LNREVTIVVAVLTLAVIVLVAALASALTVSKSVYHVINGVGSASDGRLKITLNNYHFDVGSDILFQGGGGASVDKNTSVSTATTGYAYGYDADYGLYVLLNMTFQNVGSGPAPIGAGWVAIGNSTSSLGNGEYFANATFPGEFPNASLASHIAWGGQNLPAGSSLTVWLIFGINGVSLKQATSSLVLQNYTYYEQEYGGVYEGSGAYRCPCQTPMVEFVIRP
jgi:hypothetical protein